MDLALIDQSSLDVLPDVQDATSLDRTYSSFRPRDQRRLLEWSKEEIVNDQGRPYDHAAYPHLGAPGGPMDAFDDPKVREAYLGG